MNQEERLKERQLFEAERQRFPHLFEREPMIDNEEFLKWIGIHLPSSNLPLGYLRLHPQDFVVEEISQTGSLHDVSVEGKDPDFSQEGKTVFADLVKVGISTLDVQNQIAEILNIDPKAIGYAGMKDRVALTSQAISIRNLQDKEKILAVSQDNFFLKNITSGKGAIAAGELQGNRFIIAVRLTEPLSKERIEAIKQQVEDIKEQGFWNFFSFQRFGTPRLLSHHLGLAIIKGEFENAARLFLLYPSKRELPYFAALREEAEKYWGDWQSMERLFSPFASHFVIELQLLRHLKEHPQDFLGALNRVPDQLRLWVYAYDSYLFNRKLSQLIQAGEAPLELPLLTSFDQKDWEPYRDFLAEDGVDLPSRHYKNFPSLRIASRSWPVLQQIDIHNVVFKDQIAVFAFSLSKGAYATTFLMNFFALASGLPLVKGISQEKVDVKEVTGLGTLQPTLERFKAVLEARQEDIPKDSDT